MFAWCLRPRPETVTNFIPFGYFDALNETTLFIFCASILITV